MHVDVANLSTLQQHRVRRPPDHLPFFAFPFPTHFCVQPISYFTSISHAHVVPCFIISQQMGSLLLIGLYLGEKIAWSLLRN